VVGIHGLGSDGADLHDVFALAGVPGVVLDLPGFGASSKPDRPYPVATASARVLELLDQLGLGRPVWLGCSYGAHVSLRAALDHPHRVGGLVLVDAGGLDPHPPLQLAKAFDERLLAMRPLTAVGMAIDALVVTPNAATQDFRRRRLANHTADSSDYLGVARSAQGALRDDAGRLLERVTAPAELIHGEGDVMVPLRVAEAAAARMPTATLTTLSGTGHMPWLECPARVAERVRRAASRG
jgi:pimeloyl-ACP methyl ester carboxylesterase